MVVSIRDTHLEFLHIQSCSNAEARPISLIRHFHFMCPTEIVTESHPCVGGRKNIQT